MLELRRKVACMQKLEERCAQFQNKMHSKLKEEDERCAPLLNEVVSMKTIMIAENKRSA
jgi:cell division protein ZapA (FtsZ GTPase activity inhibitor)